LYHVIITKKIPEGKRNITLYTISRALNKLFNLNANDIYGFIYSWAIEIGLNESEIFSTISSACQSVEDFSCFENSYMAGLVNDGIAECPYIGRNIKETIILKKTLCPVYRTIKSYSSLEKIRESYMNKIKIMYDELKKEMKKKNWNECRKIINSIYKLKTEYLKGVKI